MGRGFWRGGATLAAVTVPNEISKELAQAGGIGDPQNDVYNRLLKNRIVFLGTEVNDAIANLITAQLLYLEGEDPEKDIWLYINCPGGSVTAGMAIYDTMQFVQPDVGTICMGLGRVDGPVPAVRRRQGQALRAARTPAS